MSIYEDTASILDSKTFSTDPAERRAQVSGLLRQQFEPCAWALKKLVRPCEEWLECGRVLRESFSEERGELEIRMEEAVAESRRILAATQRKETTCN